eukprot:6459475-Amphidinium_carterae.1
MVGFGQFVACHVGCLFACTRMAERTKDLLDFGGGDAPPAPLPSNTSAPVSSPADNLLDFGGGEAPPAPAPSNMPAPVSTLGVPCVCHQKLRASYISPETPSTGLAFSAMRL